MSGVNLTASIREAEAPMSLASLKAALDSLEANANVPADAALKVTHYGTGTWEIKAVWSPDQGAAAVKVEIHADPRVDPVAVAEQIQRDSRGYRKLKDQPQA